MSKGRTVRLFLVEGSATGILVAEVMNWTGHVLVAPRSKLGDALKRPEASRTGAYMLIGDDPEHPSKQRVYVGEGDSVADRIKSHAKDASKDFWTHAYLLTSKDANVTKAHARYLEGRLVELAKAAGRATVANGNEPALKQLPECDVADMEYYLTQLELILPALGVNLLRPKVSKPTPSEIAPVAHPLELVLESKKHGIKAEAVEQDGELTVLAGSIGTATSFEHNQYSGIREQLVNDGSLEATSDGYVRLTQDVTFKSPSAAAAVFFNRNSNGRTAWKVKSTGQSLKDWQDQQLAALESEPDTIPQDLETAESVE